MPQLTWLTFLWALKMKAVHSSKMSLNLCQNTWRDIPEERILLRSHCRKNVKPMMQSHLPRQMLRRSFVMETEQAKVVRFTFIIHYAQ
jgi:hypothetical protein